MVTSGQSRCGETPPRPPFLVRWALKLLSTGEERAAILNELGELYEHRRARDGDGAADAWYRRQTTQYPFRLLADRVGGKWSRHPKNSSSAERRRHRLSEAAHRLFGDFRHSATSLIKTPGLSLTIVLTVGLGIGATTTLFSVIRAVLLEPLPYPDPGRLVRIYTDARSDRYPFSAADYLALEEQQTGFSRIAGYWNSSKTFSRGDLSERMRGKVVTWSYFTLLGINPLHGRIFNESDGVIGTEGRVVVSHSFWARRLGGDEAAIGQSVQLDAADYTVVGVLPHEVGPFEQDREFFIAGQVEPPPRKGPFFITVLGRLEPATETAVAASELRAINRRIFPIWQSSYQDGSASWGMMDLKEVVVGDVGATLIIVFGAVGFVLVLASVNAANLLLARFARRRRELAVRAALGASRGRLLRLLLSESALLMAGGALIGLALAFVGIELLKNMGAGYIPRTREIGLNESILWFLTMVTLGSGLLFGLIPALHGARSRFEQNLRSGGLSATAAEESGRLRGALVVAQFAMAAPLLIGAGLLIGSLARLERVDPGIDTQNVLSFGMFLPETNYPERSDVRAFWTEALERVRALPGVGSATAGNARPPSRFPMTNNFNLEDKPTPPSESQPSVPWISVMPDYFDVLGIPLVRGRLFDDREQDDAPQEAIVDETWARRFFPGESSVGRRFRDGGRTTGPWVTVVGVVGDVIYTGLDAIGGGTVYRPMSGGVFRSRYFLVRTSTDPMLVLPSIRNVIRELDSAVPLSEVSTIDELMSDSLEVPRYLTGLVVGFSVIALLLSIIGIYGVMSYFVQQHTRDIGIRMALGLAPARVRREIVGRGMRMVFLGVTIGAVAAYALTRFMASLLFEVSATDTVTFVGVTTGLVVIALTACVVPARRASQVDPAVTLREE